MLEVTESVCVAISIAYSYSNCNPDTNPDWPSLIAAGTASVGLLFARDNKVTSEQATGKTPTATP